ncbi:MAG: hypothetical protein B6D61_12575 [Bacteroidetes bacterium 4484_249]|nr:MAG: hypothetical protein B6D61_12575 [Bacteroidetes bacterium 4484_249]
MNNSNQRTYFYNLEARGYELDSYNHVNNAVYLNYMEQARWDFFRQINLLSFLNESQKKLVVVGIDIRYKKEIKLFDKLVIETRIETQLPYLVFHHRIVNSETKMLAARAKVKTLFLDENKIPTDIPKEILNYA